MAKTVEEYLQAQSQWKEGMETLREMCLESGLKETVKWGSPFYTMDGKNLIGIVGFKSYFGLWFTQGVFLKDEEGLLSQSSDKTKAMRKMEFRSMDEFMQKKASAAAYLTEAIQNHREGKELKPRQKKKMPPLPTEMKEAFAEDTELEEKFETLTPGRRKEYILHISTAKQKATRLRRLEKAEALILAGKGLNDKYR